MKNLGNDGFTATVTIDGVPAEPATVRTVLVGNCGTLTAGLTLFPDAVLDDGVLDVATLTPPNLAAWVGTATTVLRKNPDNGPSIERRPGRDVVVSSTPNGGSKLTATSSRRPKRSGSSSPPAPSSSASRATERAGTVPAGRARGPDRPPSSPCWWTGGNRASAS